MSDDLLTLLTRFTEAPDDPARAMVLAHSFLEQACRWAEAGLAVCPTADKLKARLVALTALLAPPVADRPS